MLHTVTVALDDGDHFTTAINGTLSSIAMYYINNAFVADDELTMRQVTQVSFHDEQLTINIERHAQIVVTIVYNDNCYSFADERRLGLMIDDITQDPEQDELTQDRAKEVIEKTGPFCAIPFRFWRGKSLGITHEHGLTVSEDRAVRKVWHTMPGHTSFNDALHRIAQPKTPKETET